MFHNSIKDMMTGYRGFSYRFVKTFPVLSKGFEIETEMSIHAVDKNMQVENVIIDYRDRPQGSESKLNTYSDGFKVLRTILQLFRTYRQAAFFGGIALALLLLALIFMIPVLITYGQTGLVPRPPHADRLRFWGDRRRAVLLCRTDPANDLQKEPAGF